MVKLTLWDLRCPSCTHGVIKVFVDNLEEFQRTWFSKGISKAERERYLRSKSGEIVTDYPGKKEELNIVQRDNQSKIIRYHNYFRKNAWVEIINAYDCKSKAHFDMLNIHIRYIRFKNKFYKIASFDAMGCCRYYEGLRNINNWGNPFLLLSIKDKEYDRLSDIEQRQVTRELSEFRNDAVKSFVWYTLKEYNTIDELLNEASKRKVLNVDELHILTSDILGELG